MASVQPVPDPDLDEEDFALIDEDDLGAPSARQVPPTAKFQRPTSAWPVPKPSPPASQDSELLSFDAFLQTLSPVEAPKPAPILLRKEPILLVSHKDPIVPPRREDLHKAKELALAREAAFHTRKKSTERIQRWWRRILLLRSLEVLLRRYRLQSRFRRWGIQLGLQQLEVCIRAAWERQKELRALIWERYRETCALTIQRNWRVYLEKMRRRAELQRVREQKRAEEECKKVLRAWVKGWKTRQVMQAWPLQDILQRLRSSSPSDRPFLLIEFHQTFKSEYHSGKWMRPRILESRSRRTRVTKQSVVAQSHSPNRVIHAEFRMHSPSVSMETVSSTPKAQWTSRPVPDLPKFVAKPFLKRKTQKIAMQKVNWAGVKTKVKCWEEVKAQKQSKPQRNSLEEFMEIERQSIKPPTRGHRNRKESPEKLPQRSNSQPQSVVPRAFGKAKPEQEFGRLNTIRSLEEGDDGDKIFATYDAGMKPVRLKRQKEAF